MERVDAPTIGPDVERARGLAVRHLSQVLLWPLRLMPMKRIPGHAQRTPWQVLRDLGDASPWRDVVDEYTGDNARFHERHYNEFVTFLPCVQRFLCGEGRKARNAGDRDADAPMRVFRRCARCSTSARRTSGSTRSTTRSRCASPT